MNVLFNVIIHGKFLVH